MVLPTFCAPPSSVPHYTLDSVVCFSAHLKLEVVRNSRDARLSPPSFSKDTSSLTFSESSLALAKVSLDSFSFAALGSAVASGLPLAGSSTRPAEAALGGRGCLSRIATAGTTKRHRPKAAGRRVGSSRPRGLQRPRCAFHRATCYNMSHDLSCKSTPLADLCFKQAARRTAALEGGAGGVLPRCERWKSGQPSNAWGTSSQLRRAQESAWKTPRSNPIALGRSRPSSSAPPRATCCARFDLDIARSSSLTLYACRARTRKKAASQLKPKIEFCLLFIVTSSSADHTRRAE